jgi:hypothetical protein
MALEKSKSTMSLATSLARVQLAPLAILFLAGATLAITIEDTVRTLGPAQENLRWMLHLGLGLWELFEGAMFFLILSWGIPKVLNLRSKAFVKEPFQPGYLATFAAEYLRMLAQVLLWAILLLIPGFYLYAQLLFVPYVTLFSAAYEREEVDALALSKELTGKRFGLVFGVFLAVTATQVLVEFAPHLVPAFYTTPLRAAFLFLSFLISVWTYSFMFRLFQETLEA